MAKSPTMPAPQHAGEIRVEKHDVGYIARAQVKDGFVFFYFSELSFSRQSIDAVLEIEIESSKGIRQPFQQRIDLRSASAVSKLTTELNNAYGGKKEQDGYNWALIINGVFTEVSRKIKGNQRPISLRHIAYEDPKFLLLPFLQEGVSNLVFGTSEVGKTWWVERLALSLATGKEFMGFYSPGGKKTLFIDYEDTAKVCASRYRMLCKGLGVVYDDVIDLLPYYKPTGSIRDNVEILKKIVAEEKIDLIAIDAGGDAAGGSPSDEQKVIDLFNALDEIPCTKLVIHHEPKYIQNEQAAFYGSSYWRNLSRVAWRLELETEEQDSKLIKLSIQKKSNLPPQPVVYYRQKFWGVSIDDALEGDGVPVVTFETVTQSQLNREKPIEEAGTEALEKHGEMSVLNLQDVLGRERSVVFRKLKEMEKKGIVEQVKKGRVFLWRLKQ